MINTIALRTFLLRSFVVLCALLIPPSIYAQTSSSKLDSLFNDLDSVFSAENIPDLFRLADSLLALDSAKVSTLNLRVGYVSQIVSAGRTFGFNQYGFIPGVSYYHRSGFYGSATGYWSSEFSPQYYMTNLAVGYTKAFGKHWMINASHEFYLYNDTLATHSFNKSAQVAAYYQTKWTDAGIDYAFLYGDETAHRILANFNGRIKLKLSGPIRSIVFMPGAAFQWGNANVYYVRQPRTVAAEVYQYIKQGDFPDITVKTYVQVLALLKKGHDIAAVGILKRHGYSNDQIKSLFQLYRDGVIQQNNVFGFMNYSFSAPVIFNLRKFSLTLNYTYNIPVALPGEMFHYQPNGYFSASITYQMQWSQK
jgi:hypothetical protein